MIPIDMTESEYYLRFLGASAANNHKKHESQSRDELGHLHSLTREAALAAIYYDMLRRLALHYLIAKLL